MMDATIETLMSIIRIGENHKTVYDKYEWVCTVTWISPDTIKIWGALVAPNRQQLRVLKDMLYNMGVRTVYWEHSNKNVKVTLRPPQS
jgi:hypothetical protein